MSTERKKQDRITIHVRKNGLYKKIMALKIEESFNLSDFFCREIEKLIKRKLKEKND